jgi:hypothetical protein
MLVLPLYFQWFWAGGRKVARTLGHPLATLSWLGWTVLLHSWLGLLRDGEKIAPVLGMNTTPDDLMTTAQLCQTLGIHRNTLREWRLAGTGPRMIKLPNNELRCRRVWLEDWLYALENQQASA